jgi:transcriptional regulator with XRE-family HTH domain
VSDFESCRKKRGLSLAAAARDIGLSSKGYLSRLEKGVTPWPLELALRVEEWSDGEVKAADLLQPEQAELLRAWAARSAAASQANTHATTLGSASRNGVPA